MYFVKLLIGKWVNNVSYRRLQYSEQTMGLINTVNAFVWSVNQRASVWWLTHCCMSHTHAPHRRFHVISPNIPSIRSRHVIKKICINTGNGSERKKKNCSVYSTKRQETVKVFLWLNKLLNKYFLQKNTFRCSLNHRQKSLSSILTIILIHTYIYACECERARVCTLYRITFLWKRRCNKYNN